MSIEEMFQREETYPGSKKKLKPVLPKEKQYEPEEWEDSNYDEKTLEGLGEVRMYTIGALAKAVGVSVPTVRLWIIRKVIPEAPYKLPSNMMVRGEQTEGRRLYPPQYIHAMVRIMRKYGLIGIRPVPWAQTPDATNDLFEEWQRIKKRDRQQIIGEIE